MKRPRLGRATFHIDPDTYQVVIMAQAHRRYPLERWLRKHGVWIERLVWRKNEPYPPGHPLEGEPDHRLAYSLKFSIKMQREEPLSDLGQLQRRKALDAVRFRLFP